MRLEVLVPRGELTAVLVRDVLLLVQVTVPLGTVESWTRFERLLAYDWAMREHLAASDHPASLRRDRPSFIPAPGTTGAPLTERTP
jgi:hypothetical protein